MNFEKHYFGNALHSQGNYCSNLVCRSEKRFKTGTQMLLKITFGPHFHAKIVFPNFQDNCKCFQNSSTHETLLAFGREKMNLAEAKLYLISHSVKVSCIPLQLHGRERLGSTWRVTPTGTNSVQTAPSMFIKLWLGFTQVGKVRKQQIENGPDCVKHKTPSVSQVRRELNRHILRNTIPLLEVSSPFYLFFIFLLHFQASV